MKSDRSIFIVITCVLFFAGFISGCTGSHKRPVRSYENQKPLSSEEKQKGSRKNDLRMIASVNLTDQGIRLLKEGKHDDAISIFERSINIFPENSNNYYYLAEAWLIKGNVPLAEEFNRLAMLYVKKGSHLSRQIADQKIKIQQYQSAHE